MEDLSDVFFFYDPGLGVGSQFRMSAAVFKKTLYRRKIDYNLDLSRETC